MKGTGILRFRAARPLAAVLLLLLFPALSFANAGPVYMENYPAFSIGPRTDSPIAVDREELLFQVDAQVPDFSRVTASYFLKNTSGEPARVSMVFPFISHNYHGLDPVSISLDKRILDYRVYSGGHVDVQDYLENPDGFSEQVQLAAILARLSEPRYQAREFADRGTAALYEITFQKPADRQVKIDLTLDPAKTRALFFGEVTGIGFESQGKGSVTYYVGNNSVGEKAYILVLGEDTLKLQLHSSDPLEKKLTNTGEFILQKITEPGGPWYIQKRDPGDLYAMYVREMDALFAQGQLVSSHDMLMENVLWRNNIWVLLFEVEMESWGEGNLVVRYPLWATIDRRRTQFYVNTFAYILNPARYFQGFGPLEIRIEPNSAAPYIIDSSLPLLRGSDGFYRASLEGLPEGDLVFSTYPRAEVTFWDRTTARILPPGYGRTLAGIGILFILVLAGIPVWWRRKARVSRV